MLISSETESLRYSFLFGFCKFGMVHSAITNFLRNVVSMDTPGTDTQIRIRVA